MKKDPYTDAHGVLIHKLGITSASDLRRVESDPSFGALLRFAEYRVRGLGDSVVPSRSGRERSRLRRRSPR